MSEKLEPEALVAFWGEYLNVMNACLLQNWGAPRAVDNPAVKACQAALACQQQIHNLIRNGGRQS